jgi:hypothetical protein
MPKQKYNLFSPIEKENGDTYWHKLGSAWPTKNGGFSLEFNSLPVPGPNGRVSVLMFIDNPKPKQEDMKFGGVDTPKPGFDNDMDDDVPF